ncbi:hypothetical protein SAMN04490247_1945 [Salimicrobium halophilum]|uniref:Uncharacterized protein n=1 Tax=Salimicrobium halophilum TaxID=86666 RepID=A0A1G8TT31_9BACI|nr:hypothetical protein SAMN04490247_1945 [Salimicrobium halophilum]
MWFFLFLIGFGLAVSGGTVTITYLNLIPAGLGWKSFVYMIFTRPECVLFFIGLAVMLLAIWKIEL